MRLDVRRLNRILSFLLQEMKVMSDEERDLPMKWSIMHMYSSTQLASLLALKEGLNPEIAGLIAAFHDIGAVMTGKKENHAKNSKGFIEDVINKYNNEFRYNLNEITSEEIDLIIEACTLHSEKNVYTDKPYVELMKNVDSLDRYLHGIKTKGDHYDRLVKSFEILDINI